MADNKKDIEKEKGKEKTNIHRDHRRKTREKFYATGFRGLAPHNVLELLLFFGIPYKDTNPIAHELIERFGSLSAVFESDRKDLMQVKGMTENAACLITMILPLYQQYTKDIRKRRPQFESVKETAEFLRTLYLDNNNVERVYVLCFDANDALITYRMIGEGDIVSSRFDMRKLASVVLETNASSIILSHNHPHGDPSPSQYDAIATKQVAELMHSLSVSFKNHIIVGDKKHFSMADSYKYVSHLYHLNV